jgi:two-component system chemotaxis response regulator CheB
VKPVRVVVVEDSVTQRALLVQVIEEDGSGTVVAEAATSEEAVAAVVRHAPEVVTMDLEIPGGAGRGPGAGGIAAIGEIMSRAPTPILVLSGHVSQENSVVTMRALAAGAADAVAKPQVWSAEQRVALRRQLRTLRGVAVIRRSPSRDAPHRSSLGASPRPSSSPPSPSPPPLARVAPPRSPSGGSRPIVGLVASTGGPLALQHVIAQLGGVPAPIVVVQHLNADFSGGFVRWLEQTTHVPTHLLEGPTVPRDGEVYVAPGGRHVRLAADGRLMLSQLPELLHRPSGDELLHSLAAHAGTSAVAAVLTGMGDDGADGLRAVAAAGGACFAQDSESCAVFGMPRAAVEAGAVFTTTRLASIGTAIVHATRQRRLAGAAGTAA